ncbi:hypothetical protein BT67DRAFT_437843 [Trichocladium antarcticum]|uniref:Uncharacterized protein n=1 Tax=Trichocladium antarcticum TaxID=1450529 RepID=A0AAN6UTA1_9PEZI|nr:hypothetical protein BT67DRAFT_437843 [Trichocladium antarcticum]
MLSFSQRSSLHLDATPPCSQSATIKTSLSTWHGVAELGRSLRLTAGPVGSEAGLAYSYIERRMHAGGRPRPYLTSAPVGSWECSNSKIYPHPSTDGPPNTSTHNKSLPRHPPPSHRAHNDLQTLP